MHLNLSTYRAGLLHQICLPEILSSDIDRLLNSNCLRSLEEHCFHFNYKVYHELRIVSHKLFQSFECKEQWRILQKYPRPRNFIKTRLYLNETQFFKLH